MNRKRGQFESFKRYRAAQNKEHARIERHLKGRFIHVSAPLRLTPMGLYVFQRGTGVTYRRNQHKRRSP